MGHRLIHSWLLGTFSFLNIYFFLCFTLFFPFYLCFPLFLSYSLILFPDLTPSNVCLFLSRGRSEYEIRRFFSQKKRKKKILILKKRVATPVIFIKA